MNKTSDPSQIAVLIRLHAILRNLKPDGSDEGIRMVLPVGATISDAVHALELPKMELVYSLNSNMVGEATILHSGDALDIIPAISGG
jgi:sulfur carrier protein ThiS